MTIDFKALWNFKDPAGSEEVFRVLLEEAEGDDALSLQTQIARSHSLRSQFEDAHARLDRVEAELAGAGPEPRVRYLLERGRTIRSAGDAPAALPLFVEAVEVAGAAGLDELAIDAMHMVAIAEPDPADKLRWNREALALAERSQEPNARSWEASLHNNIGMTLHGEGRFDEALASFREARSAQERIGDPANVRVARWMIAWTLRSLGRHDDALEILYSLQVEVEAAGDPDGYVYEEIGENLRALGRAEEAQPYLEQAASLFGR